MQESSTAGLSLPSERIRIRTGLIVEKVGQGRSLLDARIAFAVMIEIDLDPKSNESGRNINKKIQPFEAVLPCIPQWLDLFCQAQAQNKHN